MTDVLPAWLRAYAREIVDAAWNEATESDTVPATEWADRIIDRVAAPAATRLPHGEAVWPEGGYISIKALEIEQERYSQLAREFAEYRNAEAKRRIRDE